MHNESCRWTCRLALRCIQDKCGFTTTIKETKGHEDCDTDWHLFVSTVRLETICKQSFKQIMQTCSPVGGLWICTTVFFALYLASIVRAAQADGWQKDFTGIRAWLIRYQRCFSTPKKPDFIVKRPVAQLGINIIANDLKKSHTCYLVTKTCKLCFRVHTHACGTPSPPKNRDLLVPRHEM